MNRYTFALPSENRNALKYVDFEFSELKKKLGPSILFIRVREKNDEIQKETLISLSLLVNLLMHFDFPERMCMYLM